MIVQTKFEPLRVRSACGFSVLRTADLQELLRRLYNAESGFDYAVRHEIPRIQKSRDQHMLNARQLREQLTASGIETAKPPRRGTGSARKGESPTSEAGDAQK